MNLLHTSKIESVKERNKCLPSGAHGGWRFLDLLVLKDISGLLGNPLLEQRVSLALGNVALVLGDNTTLVLNGFLQIIK